jgi:putative ABC transport system substrate-binding protein
MPAEGQNPKCSSTITRPLPPTADMPLHRLWSESCRFCCKNLWYNPNGNLEKSTAQDAAAALGRQIVVLKASSESKLDTAFASMAQQRIGALLGASDPFLFNRRDQIVLLAARHAIPAIYYLRDFARAGGLMTYGNSLTDMYRLVGVYAGRVLKGEKATDLPVAQSTKFEFVINLQAARALGIEVPNSMQLLADEVIE